MAIEPGNCSHGAHMPQLLKPARSRAHAPQAQETAAMRRPRTATRGQPPSAEAREASVQQQRPGTATNKQMIIKKQ